MMMATHKAGIGELAFVVPLQEIDFGDSQRLARTAVARNDVNGKVVPRSGAAGGDDPVGRWVQARLAAGDGDRERPEAS